MHPRMVARTWPALLMAALTLHALPGDAQAPPPSGEPRYEHEETRALVALVSDAAEKVRTEGRTAFPELATPESRWRQGETYVFVIDPEGTMLVHPDPALEGKNELELRDVHGKPIIRGLIEAATRSPDEPEGWYHYEWPVPGAILPRWKSSYVRRVEAPSGERYVVGGGMYDDRMEKAFIVDMVDDAVARIEARGEAAYPLFYDPAGPFLVKDTYVFVFDPQGVELVNPAFPNLEGQSLLDRKDTQGKLLVREMLHVVEERGSGWVDYMWPKPGDNASTQKSAYVRKARLDDGWVLVGAGAYLADAPEAARVEQPMTAAELTVLVRDAAALLEERGEAAYADFREKGSRWFRDETYLFVWTMDGTRVFHAADPAIEGQDVRDAADIRGRPYGRFFLEAARSPSGEGWVHYMYPEPGDVFPAWKSTFVKRATFPSGDEHLVGSGIYYMKMDRAFIEDVVDHAARLVEEQGSAAFDRLRDPTGPFVFMDTYVFVDTPDGTELVNGGQPSLEGRNILDLEDLNGKKLAREYIAAAMEHGDAWVGYTWYRPGSNEPARKQTRVRKVESGGKTYIVGSGFYVD